MVLSVLKGLCIICRVQESPSYFLSLYSKPSLYRCIKRFKQITIEKLLLLKSSIKIEFLLTSKFSIAIIGYSVYI